MVVASDQTKRERKSERERERMTGRGREKLIKKFD